MEAGMIGRNAITNGGGRTIKKHAHLNWVPKWTFGCPSLSLVDLLVGFCMCGVGDKQRAKQREEHFYCNHNCTHTH
jgi:hypothetical protein